MLKKSSESAVRHVWRSGLLLQSARFQLSWFITVCCAPTGCVSVAVYYRFLLSGGCSERGFSPFLRAWAPLGARRGLSPTAFACGSGRVWRFITQSGHLDAHGRVAVNYHLRFSGR